MQIPVFGSSLQLHWKESVAGLASTAEERASTVAKTARTRVRRICISYKLLVLVSPYRNGLLTGYFAACLLRWLEAGRKLCTTYTSNFLLGPPYLNLLQGRAHEDVNYSCLRDGRAGGMLLFFEHRSQYDCTNSTTISLIIESGSIMKNSDKSSVISMHSMMPIAHKQKERTSYPSVPLFSYMPEM